MLKNYFKIAWRNLRKNQSHALINVLGLAIGITCCLLIVLWVADELSYDKWNEKADRTYRLTSETIIGGSHRQLALTPGLLSTTLRNDFPEVETSVRFVSYGSAIVKKEDQNFREANIIYTDSTFFDVFSVKLIEGNPKKALVPPKTIVISEKMAKKYFPNENPLGKTLTLNNHRDFVVNGVMENIPANSHFNFDFLISLTRHERSDNENWLSNSYNTYYVLREGTDVKAFEAKAISHLLTSYIVPEIEQVMGKSIDAFHNGGNLYEFHYQPLLDIHLKSNLEGELGVNGSILYVWIFAIAALFILIMACVNFMNLTTARSAIRGKEIGIRKILGSNRSSLIYQFLAESFLMTMLAFVLAIMFMQMSLPYFNEVANKELIIPFQEFSFLFFSILGIIITGLLAGAYPAFYLSGIRPSKNLTGTLFEKGSKFTLRNSLVVFQFMIAVFLIIGMLIINQQLSYIQNKKLGYDRGQVLILENVAPLNEKAFHLKNQLLSNPQISNATISGYLPIPSYRRDSPICKSQSIDGNNCVATQLWSIDEDYLSTFGIELVAGRNFSPSMITDSTAIIINETAAKLFGFENPIGKKVYGGINFKPKYEGEMPTQTIIGVVKDFHFESLRQDIGALSFWLDPFPGNLSLKVNTENLPILISQIEQTWKSYVPNQPFSYHFMDDSFDQIYRSERRFSNIINIFSGLGIFIACLGLFGLAAFATERRTKEIGIRKVLGATTANLVTLLSKDFLKLVLIALVFAIPIAWYSMNHWLKDFAYRIEIQWWIFALAGLLAILIAFFTVSFHSVKAAIANPIDSLKTE